MITKRLGLWRMLGIIAALLLWSSSAASQTNTKSDDAKVEIWRQLTSHHDRTPTRAALEEISPEARRHLARIALDEKLLPLHRHRALDALGAGWADQKTLATYTEYIAKSQDSLARYRAIKLSARHLGALAMPLLSAHTEAEDALVREAVIQSLITLKTPESHTHLDAMLEREKLPRLRSLIEEARR